MTTHKLDLGVGDVHVDTTATRLVRKTMATNLDDLTTKQRKKLPASAFALPSLKKFPIHDAAHVRNAAARLEQAKKSGSVTPAQYREARRNIARAAKKFGIQSQYLERDAAAVVASPLARRKGLHMQIGFGPNGQHKLEILHATTDVGGTVVRCDSTELADIPADLTSEARAIQAKAKEAREAGNAEEADRLDAEAKRLLDDSAPRPVWNQLAKVGTFRGHSSGPFELTPIIFAEIVTNFLATANRRIPIDFEHASEADETSGSIPTDGAPAQGWILQLENRNIDGLWGLVDWLEPARTYIRQKKYRYFSPAIRFGAKDRVTGKPIGARMTSGALTNNPFLDGMQPLAARDSTPGDTKTMSTEHIPMGSHHDFLNKCRACLKLHPISDAPEMKAKLASLRELCKDAPHADAMVQGVPLGDYLHPMREMMNLPANTSVGDILDAVEEMIDAAMERHEAEYHTMSDPNDTTNTTTTLNDDVAVALGEAKEKLRTLSQEKGAMSAQITALSNEKASLSLSLKDEKARADKNAEEVTELKGVIATLKDAENARAEQAIVETVDEAFFNYKDARKLTDDDKQDMMILARADLKRFQTRYPRIPASQAHLLQNLTGSRSSTDTTAPHVNASDRGAVDAPAARQKPMTPAEMLRLKDRLVSERKMSDSAADALSIKVAKGEAQSPFAN